MAHFCLIHQNRFYKNIILYHHELLDGSGYPLHAREIPFEAQIVNICDTFDEMICGIGCKRQRVYEAVEYLKMFKGLKYNKDIVDVFLEFTAVYPAGSHVLLSDNSIGSVIRQNKEFPDRPVVQIMKDKYLFEMKCNSCNNTFTIANDITPTRIGYKFVEGKDGLKKVRVAKATGEVIE